VEYFEFNLFLVNPGNWSENLKYRGSDLKSVSEQFAVSVDGWAESPGGSCMDIPKILAELKAERAQIEEAILSLERLALGRKRGPGRPRSTVNITGMTEPEANAEFASSGSGPKRRGRPPGSKNKPRPNPPIAAAAGGQ